MKLYLRQGASAEGTVKGGVIVLGMSAFLATAHSSNICLLFVGNTTYEPSYLGNARFCHLQLSVSGKMEMILGSIPLVHQLRPRARASGRAYRKVGQIIQGVIHQSFRDLRLVGNGSTTELALGKRPRFWFVKTNPWTSFYTVLLG